jgi:hypothetical protein
MRRAIAGPRSAWPRIGIWTACAVAALCAFAGVAHGESVLALAGITDASGDPSNTYGWQLEFHEPLAAQWSASLAWLNEGHVPGHHRDGAVTQLWFDLPVWGKRLVYSVGVGPYLYFDTQQESSARGYSDVHAAAAIFSASASLDLTESWFVNLRINDIYAAGDFNSVGFLLGAGYRLGRGERDAGAMGDSMAPLGRQQLQLFGGEMIYNQLSSRQDRTLGLDYRLSLTPWSAWSATWFHDPAGAAPLDQIASQVWLVDTVHGGRFSLAAGLGVCTPLEAHAPGESGAAAVSGLSALRVEWSWGRKGSLILTWYRTFTNDDDDRDIITLGYGLRFGG